MENPHHAPSRHLVEVGHPATPASRAPRLLCSSVRVLMLALKLNEKRASRGDGVGQFAAFVVIPHCRKSAHQAATQRGLVLVRNAFPLDSLQRLQDQLGTL